METVPYEGIRLTPSLQEAARDRAVRLLQQYYAPSTPSSGYTGGLWDSFDPAGNRTASANTFTGDDVAACALLSTEIHGRPTAELLVHQRRRFETLLERIGPDREFIEEASADAAPFEPVRELYRALVGLPHIGQTRATKLIARKRPRLVPIVDEVVARSVFSGLQTHWSPLLRALQAQDRRLWNRLIALRNDAGLDDSVPVIRVFDVLAWLDGSGEAEKVLSPKP